MPKKGSCSGGPTNPLKYTKHIKILGYGAGELGERFVELKIRGVEQSAICLIRLDKMPDKRELAARLTRKGAHLIQEAAINELLRRIQEDGPQAPTFHVAMKLGWHGRQFVLPEGAITCDEPPLRVHLEDLGNAPQKYRMSGRLKAWKEIPRLAHGNSRLMLALALAFVGPLGDILKVEQVAIQLFGDPGSGKSAIAIAAGSVWGCHLDPNRAGNHGFGETWNQTINNLETIAYAHNHTLLILDESRAADRRAGSLVETLTNTAMRFEKSVQKGRMTDTDSRSWWVPLLSTSNLSLDQLARETGFYLDDAHRGRLIDVPNPTAAHGAFEELHGFAGHSDFSGHLIKLALAQHGTAATAFLQQLVAWRREDRKGLKSWLEKRRAFYLKRAAKITSADRDLLRIHGKFATIYAAGRLAGHFGLLPWNWRSLLGALLRCERDHVAHVARVGGPLANRRNPESELQKLWAYVAENERSFIDLRRGLISDPQHNHAACPGYISDYGGKVEYLFPAPVLLRIAGNKAAAQRLKAQAAALGGIATVGGGAGGDRYAVKRPIFAKGTGQPPRLSVMAFSASIIRPSSD